MPLSLSGTTGIVSANIQDGAIQTVDIANGAVTPAKLGATNTVLKVVSTQITAPTTVSIVTAGTFYDIAGFSASITPSSSANKILVSAYLSAGCSFTGYQNIPRLVRDSTVIAVGDAGGSGQPQALGNIGYASAYNLQPFTILWLDSPSTTSPTTYKFQCTSAINGATVAYNRVGGASGTESNDASSPRSPSQIILMEISA